MQSYFTSAATVKRNIYTWTWSEKKSSYQTTWNIYKGYLAPVTEEDWLELDKFGKQYNFTTKKTADIKEADVLTIDSIDYKVKAEAKWDWKIIKYKKVLIVKS